MYDRGLGNRIFGVWFAYETAPFRWLETRRKRASTRCGLLLPLGGIQAAAGPEEGAFGMRGGIRGFFVLLGCFGLLAATPGDGVAQLSKDDAKCVNAMNKSFAKVAATMGKEVSACVKNFGKGKLTGTAVECLTADLKGKVAKAKGKTGSDYAKKCPTPPAFGVTDPNWVNQVAVEEEILLASEIFGWDLDLNLVVSEKAVAGTKEAAGCQSAVIKAVGKCEAARLKEFGSCTKNAMKNNPDTVTAADFATCVASPQPDPKGKISKACGKVSGTISKKCAGLDLAAVFPGCNVSDAGALADCLTQAVACRTCAAAKLAGGFDATCSTCIPAGEIGTAYCTYDSREYCVGGPNDGEPCTADITNADCGPPGDRGNCLGNSMTDLRTRLSASEPVFDITMGGRLDFIIGTPDPVTGLADMECYLDHSWPIDFGPMIGVACLENVPIANCQEQLNTIDCDGGEPLNLVKENFHNIGDCGLGDDPNETDPNNNVGPAECQAMCEDHCAGRGANLWRANCEGYCNGGDLDGVRCTLDIDCQIPNPTPPPTYLHGQSGECPGADPVAHDKICQCECISIGADGMPSRPGGYVCCTGVISVVEPEAPCDGINPSMINFMAGPRTTESIIATIYDADNFPGETIFTPPLRGLPSSCRQLSEDNLGSHLHVGNQSSQDGGLGDQSQVMRETCEGPGFPDPNASP
jgi:hypothetical protein